MNYYKAKKVFIENQSSHLDGLSFARKVIAEATVCGVSKLKVAPENYKNFSHSFDVLKGQGYLIIEELCEDGFIHLDIMQAN